MYTRNSESKKLRVDNIILYVDYIILYVDIELRLCKYLQTVDYNKQELVLQIAQHTVNRLSVFL